MRIESSKILPGGWDPDRVEPSRLRLVRGGEEVPTLLVGGLAKRFTIQDKLIIWAMDSTSPVTGTNVYYLGLAPSGQSPLRIPDTRREDLSRLATVDAWPVVDTIEEDLQLETKEGNFLSIEDMRWVWQLLPTDKACRFLLICRGMKRNGPSATARSTSESKFYIGKGSIPSRGTIRATLNRGPVGEVPLVSLRTDPLIVLTIPPDSLEETGNELELRWISPAGDTPIFLDS